MRVFVNTLLNQVRHMPESHVYINYCYLHGKVFIDDRYSIGNVNLKSLAIL